MYVRANIKVFNRDREQLERSLDSLRRCTKTDAMATKRDLGKMIREGVLLTKVDSNMVAVRWHAGMPLKRAYTYISPSYS